MAAVLRTPFPPDFPPVIIHQKPNSTVRLKGEHYEGAKKGDSASAAKVICQVISEVAVAAIHDSFSRYRPILAAPFSELGNLLPLALAEALGARLQFQVDDEIVQTNRGRRSAQTASSRLFTRISFDGAVHHGREYVLVDDVVTQGGTFADLRGHIEGGGGRVVGATAILAGQRSNRLQIAPGTLERLRRIAGNVETDWVEAFGFDFASLTESEGRALQRFAFWNPYTIRSRIIASSQESYLKRD